MFKNSMQKKLRSRFHITPDTGFDFEGILIQCDGGVDGYSVFADVIAYPEQAAPETIKGELYIRNSRVVFSQLVP